MLFDPANKIIKLCTDGMSLEGEGKKEEALRLFQQAWDDSTNDFEKFTSAHYIARHQKSVSDKLKWDMTALQLALNINDENIKGTFPSLYLNIAKCHEDLKDLDNARKNYELAFSNAEQLPDNGYGNMIRNGILNGMKRIASSTNIPTESKLSSL